MKITKLHVLISVILAAALASGGWMLRTKQKEKAEKLRVEKETQRKAEQDALRKRMEELAAQAPPPAPEPAPAPVEEKPKQVSYQVRRGDTLWKIAKMPEHYGEGHRWYDIWKANEDAIEDFDHLNAGQTLVVPLDKPEGSWAKTSEEKKDRILKIGGDGVAVPVEAPAAVAEPPAPAEPAPSDSPAPDAGTPQDAPSGPTN